MSRTFKVAFGVIVAAQLALLLAFIGVKEYALNTGDTVVLQTVPVDPRSLLQGDFVVLRYKISTLPPRLENLPTGRTVYVSVVEKGEVWEARSYSTSRPSNDEVFIKGTVDSNRLLEFGIGTYFVPEGTGQPGHELADVLVDPPHEAGDLAVLGVYIGCDRLKVLNDPRLELDRLDQLFVHERESGRC